MWLPAIATSVQNMNNWQKSVIAVAGRSFLDSCVAETADDHSTEQLMTGAHKTPVQPFCHLCGQAKQLQLGCTFFEFVVGKV